MGGTKGTPARKNDPTEVTSNVSSFHLDDLVKKTILINAIFAHKYDGLLYHNCF